MKDIAWQKNANLGTVPFVVQSDSQGRLHMPGQPHQANELILLDQSDKARIIMKIYAPPKALPYDLSSAALAPNTSSR